MPFLEINGRVILGTQFGEFEITDAEIICDDIELRSKLFVVHSSSQGQAVRIVAANYTQVPASIDIKTRGPGTLEVFWPGGNQYPWARYYIDQAAPRERVEVADAFLGLRRILTWFRRDRKHDFARHRDLINNVAVGEHVLRRALLGYLFDRQIIYEVAPLYIFDENVATRAGINWPDIRSGRMTDQVREFLEPFMNRREG